MASDKQSAFINYYVGEANFNGTKAAELAGYAVPRQEASRLLSNADIRKEIDARLAALTLTKSEILSRLTAHALASVEDYISDSGFIDLAKMRKAGMLHLIKRIKRVDGEKSSYIEVELHDAQAALVHLGRYYALFTDRHENEISGELRLKAANELTDDELATIAAAGGGGTDKAP